MRLVVVSMFALLGCSTVGGSDTDAAPEGSDGGTQNAADGAVAAAPRPCRIDTDVGQDGTINRRDSRTYIDDLLRTVEQDNNVDGTLDYIQVRTYNSMRQLIIITYDTNADSVLDQRRTYNYGLNNKVAMIIIDVGDDGTDDQRWLHVYDSEDRLVTIEKDTNADGNLDINETWQYNAEGLVYRIERDTNLDGALDYVELRSYDGDYLTLLERDTNVDAVIDYRYTLTRGSQNEIETLELDSNADGTLEETRYYLYDCTQ